MNILKILAGIDFQIGGLGALAFGLLEKERLGLDEGIGLTVFPCVYFPFDEGHFLTE